MGNFYTKKVDALCFDRSRWEAMLWADRLDASSTLARHTRDIGGSLPVERGHDAATFGGEVFARLYADPEQVPTVEGAEWAALAHETLSALPEWDGLRASVAGDPDFAALASADLLRTIASKMADIMQQARKEEEQDGESDDGTGINGRDVLRAALRKACNAAQEMVDDTRGLLNGLAPGLGHVPATHEQADPARMKLAEQIRNDRRLKDVLDRAGKLTRIASKAKQVRSVHAREEVVDVERGADLARVLPAQLAGIRHPLLRRVAMRGLVERSLVQYRLEGKEPLGRGPIVVLLDESGSMQGDGHKWARAVGIACIATAAKEKRDVLVMGFDDEVRYSVRIQPNGYATRNDKPINGVAAAAMTIASVDCGGGTNFDVAFKRGLDVISTIERADLVFVTDGQCDVSKTLLDRLNASKALGLRVFALTVNGGSVARSIAALADESVDIDRAQDKDGSVAACIP
jgi:uncharacterized protein with von Willebrand factor type A (vWA) domain